MSFTPLSEASDDHADFPEGATGLEVGASGELEAALDRDYFRIEVAGDSPGQLWVESTGETRVDGALLSGDGALLDAQEGEAWWPNFVVGAHVVPGTYSLRVAGNGTATGTYGLTANFVADNRTLPLFISASHSVRQGFARIINHSDRSGDVTIHAIDDAGQRSGPVTLSLDAGQAAHFNADDLENGNEAKGLSGSVGAGEGDWQLELATDLDIEALAYVRTNDGFLTSMHELSGMHDAWNDKGATVPTFNPASNLSQVSKLRLVSRGPGEVSAAILGVDDGGSSNRSGGFRRRVFLDVAAEASLTVTAQELESGSHAVGRYYVLGDGEGKWRLNRWQPRRRPVGIMSLLESPTGHLTNLSRRTPIVGTDVSLPLFIAAGDPVRQGFARIINYGVGGEVTIHAIDDAGQRRGPVTLSLAGGQTAHFNSEDLEDGNPAKGLSGGVGDGEGDWRLELAAESHMHIEALAYVRTADGFLTGMNALAPLSDGVREVVFFNPGSNNRQVSKLRLVNPADADAAITVSGIDDAGNAAPAGDVTLTVPAGAAAEITAQQLEAGAGHFDGRFGDGQGKWRLFIEADQDIQAMSLLESPTGHIANLSSGTAVR